MHVPRSGSIELRWRPVPSRGGRASPTRSTHPGTNAHRPSQPFGQRGRGDWSVTRLGNGDSPGASTRVRSRDKPSLAGKEPTTYPGDLTCSGSWGGRRGGARTNAQERPGRPEYATRSSPITTKGIRCPASDSPPKGPPHAAACEGHKGVTNARRRAPTHRDLGILGCRGTDGTQVGFPGGGRGGY